MLPPFDKHGNLPPGIHLCTVEELVSRFGTGSDERVVETNELLQVIAWARRAGVARLLVNGSYVSAVPSPNDVDVVVLAGPDYPRGEPLVGQEEFVIPFVHILVAASEADFSVWANDDFATDKAGRPKGVVEVML